MGAIAAIKPGVPYRDVHLGAAKSFVTDLTSLGLMKGNADEAVAAGAHALFFPHGLGHMMGMDVHDMENLGEDIVGYGAGYERSTQFGLNYLRLARPLEAGFVLTVEPGLYFIPALIDQWKAKKTNAAFINFKEVDKFRDARGYRIEDDVLVTPAGRARARPADSEDGRGRRGRVPMMSPPRTTGATGPSRTCRSGRTVQRIFVMRKL